MTRNSKGAVNDVVMMTSGEIGKLKSLKKQKEEELLGVRSQIRARGRGSRSGPDRDPAEDSDLMERAETLKTEIARITDRLENAQELHSGGSDHIDIGSQFTIEWLNGSREGSSVTLTITNNGDTEMKTIYHEAPLAQAVIGHSVGEEIEYSTPGGQLKARILEVS